MARWFWRHCSSLPDTHVAKYLQQCLPRTSQGAFQNPSIHFMRHPDFADDPPVSFYFPIADQGESQTLVPQPTVSGYFANRHLPLCIHRAIFHPPPDNAPANPDFCLFTSLSHPQPHRPPKELARCPATVGPSCSWSYALSFVISTAPVSSLFPNLISAHPQDGRARTSLARGGFSFRPDVYVPPPACPLSVSGLLSPPCAGNPTRRQARPGETANELLDFSNPARLPFQSLRDISRERAPLRPFQLLAS